MYKAFDRWLLPYLMRRRPKRDAKQPLHLVIAFCDHFEPFHHSDKEGAVARVNHWAAEYPKMAAPFTDSDGISPKHSFFYPIEQYDAEILESIANICKETGSETEIHLHHDNDTADQLIEKLEKGKADFAEHGLLSRSLNGAIRYGFIHGDWALDNSHPSGRHCGVSGELGILRKTGCYADFTLPSAPSPTQTSTVNSIYYAKSTEQPKSHNRGIAAEVGKNSYRSSEDHLLLIQGPLGLNWSNRKAGVFPRVENADVTGTNPPTPDRFKLWLKLGVHVKGQPQVVFAKLHTHGAIEHNSKALLGNAMLDFHTHLAQKAAESPLFHYHYVSAREMTNIVHALEDSAPGTIPDFAKARNHAILPAPVNS